VALELLVKLLSTVVEDMVVVRIPPSAENEELLPTLDVAVSTVVEEMAVVRMLPLVVLLSPF
jgi:hypothetical protein